MNILIIGNGFDLAHHLPTQYSEFLDFVKAYKEGGDSEYSDVLQEFRIKKKKIGSIIFVMGFTYGWLIPAILSGSIWSCQRKVLET